jgi:hypothetical protein
MRLDVVAATLESMSIAALKKGGFLREVGFVLAAILAYFFIRNFTAGRGGCVCECSADRRRRALGSIDWEDELQAAVAGNAS